MAQPMIIDTLKFAQKLKTAGADEKLALAIVEGVSSMDTSDLATKSDLMDTSDLATKSDLRELRTELTGEINGLRTELMGEINGLRTKLTGEINGLRGELMAEIKDSQLNNIKWMGALLALFFTLDKIWPVLSIG